MGTALAFYFAAAIALIASVRVITNTNPVHALLYLVVSLLAVAMIFFAVGAPFAGALEMIVYAGAIMVLFVFVVMILNLGSVIDDQERKWLSGRTWIGPSVLSLALLVELVIVIEPNAENLISTATIGPKEVGVALFGPYVLAVELASMLLLAAMVAAWHLGRDADKEDKHV
ncbi:MAG TPA: NADH-quinone oxidoreductase subunit J [Cellvibrio sp.]|nr:NADH-quinone oxidoreductase subunit J [Cellvibrio sp.]